MPVYVYGYTSWKEGKIDVALFGISVIEFWLG